MKNLITIAVLFAALFPPFGGIEGGFCQDLFYVKGNVAVKPSASVSIKGGIIADGSASINNDGTITVANHSTAGNENWTNNASAAMLSGTGTVVFNSSEQQNISGNYPTTYSILALNNSSAAGVLLDTNCFVSDSLILNNGILHTTSAHILVIQNNATSDHGSVNSFIDGPIKKVGNQAFTFPLGNDTVWARLAISAPSLATDTFTAEYFDAAYTDVSTDGTFNNVSTVEYWTLSPDDGTSNVTVKLFWEDTARSGITDVISGDLVVARYNGVDWTSEGQSAITSSNPGDVTSNVVTNFSPFTFGSNSSAVNPLPIELLSFKARWDNDIQTTVKVEWTTGSEINNDYFELEHSSNAINWQKIATIPGSGNSNEIIYYSFYDEHPYEDITYYRLKQIDFDGSYEYSDIVAVSKTDFIEIISIFPNPSKDFINVIIISSFDTEVNLFIADASGKIVYKFKSKIKTGLNILNINTSKLASGEYIVYVVTGSGQEKTAKNFVCN